MSLISGYARLAIVFERLLTWYGILSRIPGPPDAAAKVRMALAVRVARVARVAGKAAASHGL